MFANERQNKIEAFLQQQGAVTTAKLVEIFNVSVETVRRDLLALEQGGKLTRVHGGAVAKAEMQPFLKLPERNQQFSAQKHALSLKAAEFIQNGDVIAVDSGSTAISFAQVLKERFSNLTVVTHSMDVFEILRNRPGFTLILCGGHYLAEENAFYGPLVLKTVQDLHVCKAFIFTTAISVRYGVFDYRKELYEVQQGLLNSADEVFILADSSKFEKTGLLKVCDNKPEFTYITDGDLKEEYVKIYKENGLNIYLGEKTE